MTPSLIRIFTLMALSAAAGVALAQSTTGKYKMAVAMPKTYDKAETMGLWGDYFKCVFQRSRTLVSV